MLVNIVRLKENHELVGIFAVNTIDDLFWLVDECTSPYDCEYTPLSNPGGIIWPTQGARKVEVIGEDDEGDDAPDTSNADAQFAFTDSWDEPVHYPTRKKAWKEIPDKRWFEVFEKQFKGDAVLARSAPK